MARTIRMNANMNINKRKLELKHECSHENHNVKKKNLIVL